MWAQTPNLAAGRTGNPVLLAQLGGLRNSSMLTGHHDLAVARDGPDGFAVGDHVAVDLDAARVFGLVGASRTLLGRHRPQADAAGSSRREARGGKLAVGSSEQEPGSGNLAGRGAFGCSTLGAATAGLWAVLRDPRSHGAMEPRSRENRENRGRF
jgi:hypothetical protein